MGQDTAPSTLASGQSITDFFSPLDLSYYSPSEQKRQTGVIRSNCIDCLDRTNVVQSAFAKQILQQFIVHLGLPGHLAGLKMIGNDELEVGFNQIWANNGDQISKQYAGTSALKGDFVR